VKEKNSLANACVTHDEIDYCYSQLMYIIVILIIIVIAIL
jgi:hypothetical protein